MEFSWLRPGFIAVSARKWWLTAEMPIRAIGSRTADPNLARSGERIGILVRELFIQARLA